MSRCADGLVCDRGYCVVPGESARQCGDALKVSGPRQVAHLACNELRLEWEMTGGVGRLDWSVRESPDELQVGEHGGQVRLSAKERALRPGAYVIQLSVEDEVGHKLVHELELSVTECVNALAPDLEPLCIGDDVAIDLQATGGNTGEYEWSLLEGTMPGDLRLKDGQLMGTLSTQSQGTHDLVLQVSDRTLDAGAEAGLQDELDVELVVEDCPRIIEAPAGDSQCVDEKYRLELNAVGGVEPYAWTVLVDGEQWQPPDAVLELDLSSSDPAAMDIELTVEDRAGRRDEHHLTLDVTRCPVVETRSIEGCEGEWVEQQLEASGSRGTVIWSAVSGPEWLLNGFDSAGFFSGLAVQGDEPLTVHVKDDQGTRQGVIPVKIFGQEEASCREAPELRLLELPDACSGQSYEYQADLGVEDPLQVLAQDSWPPWLELDESGRFHAEEVPTTDTSYELPLEVVVASGGARTRLRQSLVVRSYCRFALNAQVEGQGRLLLGDLREAVGSGPLPRDLSAALPDLDVTGFELSPASERIAFVGRSPGSSVVDTIAVVSLLEETDAETLPIGDALEAVEVRRIAWSHDGSRLAVLRYADGDAQLLVYRLTLDADPVVTQVSVNLASDSELFWLGSRPCYLAGLEGSATSDPWAAMSCQSSDSSGALTSANDVATLTLPQLAALQIIGTGPHLFYFWNEVAGAPYNTEYLYDDGDEHWNESQGYAVPDPTLRWLGQPGTGAQRDADHPILGLFAVGPGAYTYVLDQEPERFVSDCHRLEAWHAFGRALACRTDGGLRIALLGPDGSVAREQTVADSADFLEDSFRSSFSRDARWFLYATASDILKKVDLSQPEWTAEPALDLEEAAPTDLLLALGERMLVHSGSRLSYVDPATDQAALLHEALPEPAPCDASHSRGGPQRWCGGTSLPASLISAADGSGIVFVDQSGRIHFADLVRGTPALAEFSAATMSCAADGCQRVATFTY